jgi:hypothetical protein
MNKPLQSILLVFLVTISSFAHSQVRYLDEVFTDVQVDTSITYAENFEFYTNFASLKPLIMDVYRPVGDVATNRPVVLLSHNGSFLPEGLTYSLLGLCFNGRKDSSIVEMCKRFARRGYVAISFDYRLGWNATSSDQITRTKTIIQAVYRAMQDSKALVRYLKNDFANNGNTYGIDTGKIVIGGSNSGAYVALAASSLNQTSELSILKFVDIHGSFVKQDTLGDFDGFGGNQNHDNYPGISSRFQCALSLGGAIGDTSWIQAGETPIIAFHGVNESGTQYNTGVVTTSTGQPVIEVSGPGDFMPIVNALGNNNAMRPNNFAQGPPNRNGFGVRTTSIEGLYPFYGQKFEPWNWYDPNCYNNSSLMQTLNPGTTPNRASLYIDTVMNYTLPRLYKLMIDTSLNNWNSIQEINGQVEIGVYPNPASTMLNVVLNNTGVQMTGLRVYDIAGKLIKESTQQSSFTGNIEVGEFDNGMYVLAVKLQDGTVATHRLVIQK